MKRVCVLSVMILTGLIWCAPASAQATADELIQLDIPEGWGVVNQTGSHYAIMILTSPATDEAPAVEVVLGYFSVAYGMTAKPVEDLVALSVRGMSWPGVDMTDLKDNKGFFYKARENGNPAGLLTRSAIYSENTSLVYLVATVSATPQLADWSERQRGDILALWQSLRSGNPEVEATVTSAKKYIPPEFFQ